MTSSGRPAAHERVAVVGMGCLFPGAPTVDQLWTNVCDGVDAISDVPPGRWDPVFYDPDSAGIDRFYCRRGGFVDDVAHFEPTAFGVMPVAVDGGEPDQFLALAQAAAALDDSDSAHQRVRREKAGVIVGRGGYRTSGLARLDQRIHVAQQLVEALRALLPDVDPGHLDRVREEFVGRLGTSGPEASIGLVPNLAASRIANRFDLQGPAYTVDAACASTLVAVDHALRELHSGRCDLVLAGGAHHCHDVTLWSVFTQLRALSPSQRIRPFSRAADGVLIGEGTGFFVLKRLADAERDDDRIYAVICASGVASDGRSGSMMRPDVAGQVRALRQAWDAAQLDPATVGMVEAHGTGTPAGDQAELVCLREVFGGVDGSGRPRSGLGSIKSMIGHAMPAAGAAGLAKAVLALHHGVLPPTLHGDDPHPLLAETRFRLIDRTEPWESDGPRRAGVNAFGFGGIDAHLVLEEHNPPRRARPPRPVTRTERVLRIAGADGGEVAARLASWSAASGSGPGPAITDAPLGDGRARLAIVEVDARRLQLAGQVVAQGRPWRGRNGVWFEPEGLLRAGGKLAFLFPGVEPTFEPQVEDLAEHFDLTKLVAPLHDPVLAHASSLERQSRGIIAVGRLLHRVLAELAVTPDMVAGHSLGEWSGELATGVIPEARIDEFLDQLRPGAVQVADVVFLALGAGVDQASQLIDGLDQTAVSHDNCPHQSVVCGPPTEIGQVVERARARRVMTQELPFRSGFHSRYFADHIPALRQVFSTLALEAPTVPLWSATTCRPYPAEPDALRALAARHLVEPVRFRELVLALHDAGARVFLQVGVGNLVGFVDDTLRDRDAVAIAVNSSKRSGLGQMAQVAAALWVQGRPVDLDRLAAPSDVARAGGPRLDLGSRLVRGLTPLGTSADTAPPCPAPDRRDTSLVRTRRLSLEVEPAWSDHAFFRQPDGWPHSEDRFPLVPMTGIVEMLTATAAELRPDLVPVAVEDVAAFRWLTVDPPTEAILRATTVEVALPNDHASDPAGSVRVRASIDGHARATVVLAPQYPSAPSPALPPLRNGQPSHVDASRFYKDRHMFHGPAYQGVEEFVTLADNGSRALLRTPAAPGGLLDNAGQLMGHWLSAQATSNRLVLPTSISRIELFGPHPVPGTLVDCTVAIDHLDDRVLRADLALLVGDRLWCRVTGWEDRRFTTDARVFEALRWPERSGVSEDRDGYTVAAERWPDAATRDLVMRRYLGREERADYDGHNPLAQRQFLLGRIAVKDAVRRWLWDRGHGPLFPAEVVVANDAAGRPLVRGPFDVDLRVSLAHVDEVAVAVVAEDADVGVDLERIQPRRSNFEQLVLTSGEQALRPPDGFDRDVWLTCLWSIKEAVAKATGRGLGGRPRDFEVTEVDGNIARIGDRRVAFECVDITSTAATAAVATSTAATAAVATSTAATAAVATSTAATAAVSAGIAPGDTSKEHIVAWTLTDR